MEKGLEPLLYWRILLVGWGTVVATSFLRFAVLGDWHFGPRPFSKLGDLVLYTVSYGTAFSVVILIPMLVIWIPIYALTRRYVASLRQASTLAAALSAGVGLLSLAVIFGLMAGNVGRPLEALLPWTPVTMVIAAGLTWFAFRSEQFAGGK